MTLQLSFYLETERKRIIGDLKKCAIITSTLTTKDVVSIKIVDRNHQGEYVEVTTVSGKTGREVSKTYEVLDLLKAVNRFLIYRHVLKEVKHWCNHFLYLTTNSFNIGETLWTALLLKKISKRNLLLR